MPSQKTTQRLFDHRHDVAVPASYPLHDVLGTAPGDSQRRAERIWMILPVTFDSRLEAAVLDAMHELIAVLDRRGTIVLVNRAWREAALRPDAPPVLVTGIGLNYLEACLHAEGDGSEGARQCHAGLLSALQGREGFEVEYPCHSPIAQRWFLLRALPLESPDGGVLLIHSEITERDQLARQLRGANRALHVRNACNHVLLQASAEAEALHEVCRSIVDLGGYRFAWVGFVEDDAQKTVRPAAHAGLEDGYLASVLVTGSEGEHGRGPTGTAARTGKAALVRDIRSDPGYAPWRAEALKRGYRSSVALPFAADGVVGTLNIYAAEPDAFNPTEVDLLQELANDVSIGVAALRARAERDRAVESLRSSEEKFVTVFRSLPDSSAITRLSDGLILDVNDGFTQATGYSREEAVGRTSLDLGLWRDPAARNQVASALRRDGAIGDIEFEYGRKDGRSSVGLLASRTLVIDDEPCMLTIVRDIADRKRMEIALRDSTRRQEALLDSIPDIAWMKDAESRFIAVNEPFAKACGRTPGDLVGRTDFDIWPEDLAAQYVADDAEVMRSRTRKRVEERLVSVSGDQSWIETIKTPIVGETGEVIGTSGIARDVTERRRFAEDLLREKALSESIINSLPGVFYVLDASGRMMRWNGRLAEVSGYDHAAIGRMHALELIRPEDQPEVETAIREGFEQGHADVEARLRTLAGDTIPYIFTGMRMDADGAAYLVGMGIDISQRKRAEDALRHSEQRLQAIVSNVPVVLFGLDSAGTFTFSEGKGLEALGLKPGEVVGRCALEMYRDYPEIVQSLRLGLEGNHSRAVHAMGPIVFDVLYMPVTDDRGALTELIGVAVDITERRRAEAALGESHARLALALQAARAGAWSWDSTTNRAVWSDGNYRVMGMEPGSCEAKYENWLAHVHPDDRAAAEAAVSEAMARGGDLNIEFRVVWPDGSVHWINDVGRMIENDAGEPAGMYGIQMDITDRKLAAEAIERSEENLRVTLRSIGDAVIATDGEGHVTLMNPVAQTLTGWSEEEARGRALDEVFRIVNEETRARVQSPVQRVLAEGTVVGLANHTLLIDRDGVERPIADSGAPIRPFRDAPISGVVVVFRDQSEERQITRRLEEQEAKYRNLVDQVPAAIYVAALDRDSSSLFVSSRVEEMLGYPARQLETDPGLWLRCVHPDDRERVLAQLDRTKTTDEPFAAEYRMHAKNGREVWIADHAEIVPNSEGSPALLQGLMFDITDRKRTEEEVARLNDRLELRVEERTAELATAVRELEAFSYSVSHDLRAPLRAINGYTSLLKENEGDHLSADGQALLHRVLANTLKMERLIDDILHYSRAGRQPFEPGTVNLDELVRNVAREVAEGHPRVSIAISKLPPVNGDQTMLKQIFANLIGNALKFSAGREKPLIEVGTRDEDGQTVFYVKDNGIGFDMRYAGKLFGMFQRMHAGTDFPGSGVGLAVVKRLVERHRGRVWAQAEPDRGAVFCFTLSPPPTLV